MLRTVHQEIICGAWNWLAHKLHFLHVCSLVSQRHIHPWEGVGYIVYSRLFHLMKEAVGTARIECIGS